MAFSTGLSVQSELGYSTSLLRKPATGSVWLRAVTSQLIVLTKIQYPLNGMLYTAAVSGRRRGATTRPYHHCPWPCHDSLDSTSGSLDGTSGEMHMLRPQDRP